MGRRSKRVAFIPVRGGSKSIPKKNIKEIAGKPLVYWVIEAALDSGVFDDIFISTDDDEIVKTVENHTASEKLNIIDRSNETATDNASTESAMLEFADRYDFDLITLIQATSPLLLGNHLKQGIEQFISDKSADSLLSVCRQKRFIWNKKKNGYAEALNYNPFKRPRRQKFDGFLVENGAFYITSKEQLEKTGNRISGNIRLYEMPEETYFELDEPSDWEILESILQQRKHSNLENKIPGIKLFITDVDGVLTDAGMYYSEKGDELKKFNTRDGKGIELLRNGGIEVAIITSEDTQIVSDRAKKLNIKHLYQGIKDKRRILNKIINETKINAKEIAYIGDDINDISILNVVGFSACPSDAVETVKGKVDYIASVKGGNGCVREVADLILKYKSEN